MDPVSLTATAFSLSAGVAKAVTAVVSFSREVRDSAEDLDAICKELQALSTILGPLARSLSSSAKKALPEELVEKVDTVLGGCELVVEKIEGSVQKYRRDKIWMKMKWVMYGQGDMQKLRDSLEAYKMALSLGVQAISVMTQQDIQEGVELIRDDTQAIREYAVAIKVNTDDMLARMRSVDVSMVEQWIEEISCLSTYGESAYQGTTTDSVGDVREPESPAPLLPLEGDKSNRGLDVGPNVRVADASFAASKTRPDIVVAVDLGTESTAVAWVTPHAGIQVISNWPGSHGPQEKVPTLLSYNSKGNLASWGFWCADDDQPGETRREMFKVCMEEGTLRMVQETGNPNLPKTTDEAEQLVTRFLQEVYSHVKKTIEVTMHRDHHGGWGQLRVEFRFSVPDTWNNQHIINRFSKATQSAGFGTEGPLHSTIIDLTEAEAAAVSILKQNPMGWLPGDIFLVMHAGAATTNLALMQVTPDKSSLSMSSIRPVSGANIGDEHIDELFVQLVRQRLAADLATTAKLPRELPFRMAKSDSFQKIKHNFGHNSDTQQVYKIRLEGVASDHNDFDHAGLGIQNGRMIFSYQEIQTLFDPHIEIITKLVRDYLDCLETSNVSPMPFVLLSGLLGSSPYLYSKMKEALEMSKVGRVVAVPFQDPQLLIVKGLLLEEQQKWQTGGGPSVLASRCARASYGVIVREIYSPIKHVGQVIWLDADGSKWAVDQIEWLVKQGGPIGPDAHLYKSFSLRLKPGDPKRCWNVDIVISNNKPDSLPRSIRDAGAVKLCTVRANLEGVTQDQFILMRASRGIFSRATKYYICKFDIRMIISSAEVRFELWFKGKKFSGSSKPISVTWDPPGSTMSGT